MVFKEAFSIPGFFIKINRQHLESSEELTTTRERSRVAFVTESLLRRYGRYGVEAIGGSDAVGVRIRGSRDCSAAALTETLGKSIETALSKRA